MARRFWLMKSEPGTYSIGDLEEQRITGWDGVRNYQARNFMRDDMAVGDLLLFYHSSANPPGVAGVGRVAGEARPDPTAFDSRDPHHDPRSDPESPTWVMVDVEFVERFPELVPLSALRNEPKLDGMLVTRKGQRLSIQPVEPGHFRIVRRLGRRSTGR